MRSNCTYCNRSFKWHSSRQIHEQGHCPKRPPRQQKTLSFNQQLISGLFKIRNRDSVYTPSTRDWLRQCIRLERTRRSR